MKNLFFGLCVLFSASHASASSLVCNMDGSFRGFKSVSVIQMEGPSVEVISTIESVLGLETVTSLSAGSIDAQSILVHEYFQMGIGTTRYTLEKTGSKFELVESIQCDSINGEERCPVYDDEFRVQSRSTVSCMQN